MAQFTFDWVIGRDDHLSQKAKLSLDIFRMEEAAFSIKKRMHEIHTFILWHYTKGSVYDTVFWRAARAETTAIFEQPNENFQQIFNFVMSVDCIDCRESSLSYGQWPVHSIKQWYDEYVK